MSNGYFYVEGGVLKHADNELYHYGVKGMKWYQNVMSQDDWNDLYDDAYNGAKTWAKNKIKTFRNDVRSAIDDTVEGYANSAKRASNKVRSIVRTSGAGNFAAGLSGKRYMPKTKGAYGSADFSAKVRPSKSYLAGKNLRNKRQMFRDSVDETVGHGIDSMKDVYDKGLGRVRDFAGSVGETVNAWKQDQKDFYKRFKK